jgi:hypothetical protein
VNTTCITWSKWCEGPASDRPYGETRMIRKKNVGAVVRLTLYVNQTRLVVLSSSRPKLV